MNTSFLHNQGSGRSFSSRQSVVGQQLIQFLPSLAKPVDITIRDYLQPLIDRNLFPETTPTTHNYYSMNTSFLHNQGSGRLFHNRQSAAAGLHSLQSPESFINPSGISIRDYLQKSSIANTRSQLFFYSSLTFSVHSSFPEHQLILMIPLVL